MSARVLATIGDKKVVYQTTLLVQDGEIVSFDVDVDTRDPLQGQISTPIKFEIRFNPSVSPSGVRWNATSGTIRLDFDAWVASVGTALKEPVKLGAMNWGAEIFFHAYHHRVGTTNRLDFQVLIKEAS